MGQQESRADNVKVEINIFKGQYTPGENIVGQVIIDVGAAGDAHLESVTVQLTGEELASWRAHSEARDQSNSCGGGSGSGCGGDSGCGSDSGSGCGSDSGSGCGSDSGSGCGGGNSSVQYGDFDAPIGTAQQCTLAPKCITMGRSKKGRKKYFSNKAVFFALRRCLAQHDEAQRAVLPRGAYAYNFSFALPQDLPSCLFVQGKNFTVQARYVLHAKVLLARAQCIENFNTVTVHEAIRPLEHNRGAVRAESDVAVKTWGFFSRGHTTVRGRLDRSVYLPTDPFTLELEIDNGECTVPVQRVTVSLRQILRLRAQDGREHTIRQTLWQRHFSGAREGTVEVLENRRVITLLVNGGDQGARAPAADVAPTNVGSVMALQYAIGVNVDMDAFMPCAPQPEIVLPIVVLRVPPAESAPFAVPNASVQQGFQYGDAGSPFGVVSPAPFVQ